MRRMAWFFTLTVVSCFSLLYFSNFFTSKQQELEAGLHDINSFSYLVAENVSRSFDAVDLITNELRGQFSQSGNWQTWSDRVGHELLAERKTRALPQLRDFAVYDQAGQQRFHSTLLPTPAINISDRPYFKALQQGADRALYGPFKGRNSGKFTYTLSRRISDSGGHFAGVMFASIEPSYFQTLCQNTTPTQHFELYLVNQDGLIIAGCQSRQDTQAQMPPDVLGASIKQYLAEGQFFDTWQKAETQYLGGFHFRRHAVRNYPELWVVTASAETNILSAWRDRQLHIGFMYLSGVLITLAAFGLIRQQMARLQEVTRQLRGHRDELEEKVKAATRSLEEKTAAAEAANVAKGAFLANMSHEIRTPLNAVLGMSYLALKTELNDKQRTYLNKIVLSGEHLLGLINNLLDMSKIEAGKIELDLIDFSLAGVMERARYLLEDKAKDKGLDVLVEIDPNLPEVMHGDSLRLTQILVNFLDNAIKFSDSGTIQMQATLQQQTPQGCMVRLEVRDHGVGMTEKQLKRLFQPFNQADSSTSRKFGGTGLGLAISKQLATLMAGDVGVSSQPGRGSTFWFTAHLQAAKRPTALAQSASTEALHLPSVAGLRVLLAEDNQLNQEVASEMLKDLGVRVEVAGHGQEVLDWLDHQAFDCVLMDCQMPGMDGYETTRRIRTNPAFKSLHVIAMTANASATDRALCLAAGMNDYLAKPVDPLRLHAMLAFWHPDEAVQPPVSPGLTAEPDLGGGAKTGDSTDADTDVLDVTSLGRLVHHDPVRLRNLIDTYLASTREHMSGLQQAMADQNVAQQAFWAHKIKGSAPWIGAHGLAKQCERLQQCAMQAEAKDLVPALTNDVLLRCEAILAYLSREISSP
jgi:signal transduction histidine kinase/HPt (histidine-containing phosphotransfer) domain-containing protein/ActR/RegA family two-component response regulator